MKEQSLILFEFSVNGINTRDRLGLKDLLDEAYKCPLNLVQLINILLRLSVYVRVGIRTTCNLELWDYLTRIVRRL